MIQSFFLTPIGKKLAVLAGLLAIIGGVFTAVYLRGRTAGKREGAALQLEDDRRQMIGERKLIARQVAAAQERERQADEAVRHHKAAAAEALRELAAVRAQRKAVQAKVAELPDAALLTDVTDKLALREKNDSTPELYPRELRAVDAAITDYPLLQRENTILGERAGALEAIIRSLDQKATAIEIERDAWKLWAGQVETHYVRVYNALPRKGNRFLRIITFGLAGKARKLQFPSPNELVAAKPGGGS